MKAGATADIRVLLLLIALDVTAGHGLSIARWRLKSLTYLFHDAPTKFHDRVG